MFSAFGILGIINIFLIFFFSLRVYHNIIFSLTTAFLLAILPWHILLIKEHSTYVFILTIILIFSIIFAPKIKIYTKKIGISLMIISATLFFISIINIPKYTNVEVDFQRTYASLTKFDFLSTPFSNKFIESYRKRESLLFQNLDFGNYFFAGHPRQRVGIKEIPKFYISMLPLILLGIIKLQSQRRWLVSSLLIFAVILPILFDDKTIESGSLLILPIVLLSIIGLYSLKRYAKIFLGLILVEAIFFLSYLLRGYI